MPDNVKKTIIYRSIPMNWSPSIPKAIRIGLTIISPLWVGPISLSWYAQHKIQNWGHVKDIAVGTQELRNFKTPLKNGSSTIIGEDRHQNEISEGTPTNAPEGVEKADGELDMTKTNMDNDVSDGEEASVDVPEGIEKADGELDITKTNMDNDASDGEETSEDAPEGVEKADGELDMTKTNMDNDVSDGEETSAYAPEGVEKADGELDMTKTNMDNDASDGGVGGGITHEADNTESPPNVHGN